ATANVSEVATWMDDPQSNGGNSRLPTKSSDFTTVQLRLPADIPANAALTLAWVPQIEGGTYTDDLMIKDVKLLEAEAQEVPDPEDGEGAAIDVLPDLTDIDLISNGDFKSYANANEWGYKGNVYGGFADWVATGSLMDNAWLMDKTP